MRFRMRDGSGEIELRHLVEDMDRYGNVRVYYRVQGKPKIRLRAQIGTPAFLAEYRAAAAGKTEPGRPVRTAAPPAPAHSLSWLIQQYYGSAEFKGLDPSTRRVRRLILDHVCEADGSKPYALVEPKHLRKRRDARAEKPEGANGMIKSLRQVFAYAVANDLMKSNPAAAVPYLKAKGDGHHSWSAEEVERFEAKHPIGSMPRLALTLLLYTGQRRSDVVTFGPGNIRGGWLRFTQFKNRQRNPVTLDIPMTEELKRVIAATTIGKSTFLVTVYGKPFTSNGFGNWFRRHCDAAGLPHCSAHGLRKAAASRLAEAGASEHEIMAITGHRTSKEVMRYTRAARQRVLAESAMARHRPPEIRPTVPLSSLGESGGTNTTSNSLKDNDFLRVMVPRDGVEPPTLRFSVACSTS